MKSATLGILSWIRWGCETATQIAWKNGVDDQPKEVRKIRATLVRLEKMGLIKTSGRTGRQNKYKATRKIVQQ